MDWELRWHGLIWFLISSPSYSSLSPILMKSFTFCAGHFVQTKMSEGNIDHDLLNCYGILLDIEILKSKMVSINYAKDGPFKCSLQVVWPSGLRRWF